jgi:hypothetical protein
VSGLTSGPFSRETARHVKTPIRTEIHARLLLFNKYVTTHPRPCLVLVFVSLGVTSFFDPLFAGRLLYSFSSVCPILWPVVSRLNMSASGRRPAAYSLPILVLLFTFRRSVACRFARLASSSSFSSRTSTCPVLSVVALLFSASPMSFISALTIRSFYRYFLSDFNMIIKMQGIFELTSYNIH